MAYRAEILHRTGAAFHFAYGLIAAVVLAFADLDAIGIAFGLGIIPIYYIIMVRAGAAAAPRSPAPGTRLASPSETVRRAVRTNLAVGVVHAALLAGTIAIDEPLWILPGILLGTAAAMTTFARHARADATLSPGTLRVLPSAWGGRRGPLLWRSEWGDVAP